MMVERLFLAVPWGCLQFVIVVFPDHTHLLFLMVFNQAMNITGKDISHLCHKLCVRGEHLSAEPRAVNNARQKCVNRCCCSGHAEFLDCVLYLKF